MPLSSPRSRIAALPSVRAILVLSAGLFLAAGLLLSRAYGADTPHEGFDLSISSRATTSQIGLPKYPGARIDYKNGRKNNMAHVMAALGRHEFRLAVMTLISRDPPEKVARFYRRALAQYGRVVDCARAEYAGEKVCDNSKPYAGYALQSGDEDDQHIVGIERKDGKTEISLVYLRLKGLDN